MKKLNLQTGKIGEEIAKKYLQKKGYKIIEQNYKTKYGEIDLVCQKEKELVIVEVRTKMGDMYGTPEDSLTKKKLRKIWLNGLAYTKQKRWQGPWRIDAVCLLLNRDKQYGAQEKIEYMEHYENIV